MGTPRLTYYKMEFRKLHKETLREKMATKEEILEKATDAVITHDRDSAKKIAAEALAAGIPPLEIIEKGFTRALEDIGKKFEEGKLHLPQLIMSCEAMVAGINILKPELERQKGELKNPATVLIGTIEGDIHSIGKDVVVTMLRIAGFEVIDLGTDVSIEDFLEEAENNRVDIIASSALMTTSMYSQKYLEERLREEGLRERIKTMVGGGPVTEGWANKIGADIYAENATDAVNKLKALISA